MDDIEVRDAATVMLLRDTDDGIEVFMLRRNLNSDFVGGAYVFPGGAVDPADRHDPELAWVCEGRTAESADDALGITEGGLAYWVAAVRECFEEAGVLLAHDAQGTFVSFTDPEVAARFERHREDVDRGRRRLAEVCREEGLVLAVDEIHYFSHWITPKGPPRRYDTRFFVCRAPEGQEPLHDDRETVASLWVRPSEALRRHREGELEMILPTIRNLMALERFETADEALGAAAIASEIPVMLPVIVEAPDSDVELGGRGVRILLPGDEGYEEALAEA